MKFMNMVRFLPAFLTSGGAASFDLSSVMSSAVDTVKADALTVLALVVPALVVVVGAGVGVRYGLKWLRCFSKH